MVSDSRPFSLFVLLTFLTWASFQITSAHSLQLTHLKALIRDKINLNRALIEGKQISELEPQVNGVIASSSSAALVFLDQSALDNIRDPTLETLNHVIENSNPSNSKAEGIQLLESPSSSVAVDDSNIEENYNYNYSY